MSMITWEQGQRLLEWAERAVVALESMAESLKAYCEPPGQCGRSAGNYNDEGKLLSWTPCTRDAGHDGDCR